MSKTTELTDEQKKLIDDTVTRRVANTGETREEAAHHIAEFLRNRAEQLDG